MPTISIAPKSIKNVHQNECHQTQSLQEKVNNVFTGNRLNSVLQDGGNGVPAWWSVCLQWMTLRAVLEGRNNWPECTSALSQNGLASSIGSLQHKSLRFCPPVSLSVSQCACYCVCLCRRIPHQRTSQRVVRILRFDVGRHGVSVWSLHWDDMV